MRINIFPHVSSSLSMKRYWEGLLRGFSELDNIDVKSYGNLEKPAGIFRRYILPFIMALNARSGFNIVLSERFSFLLWALNRRSSVVVCHDLVALLNPNVSWIRKLRYRLLLHQMRYAGAIVCISENTKNDLLKFCSFLNPDKVKVIYNGLEKKWLVPSTELLQATSIKDVKDRRFFLVVGTDAWNKNFKLVIQSFADFESDVVLVRLGPVSETSRAQVRQLNMSERMIQLENVSDEELKWLYGNAVALIFPSLHEGFGWPPLEAMACRCPVIASDIPVVREICDKAVCYIDPVKKETLTEAMRILAADNEYREGLIRAGSSRVKNFSWEITAKGFCQVIEDIKQIR